MMPRLRFSTIAYWLLAAAWAAIPSLAGAAAEPGTYAVDEYGAKLDGHSNDRAALQAAIDAATAAGGGTVVIPAGRTLLSGAFELKSNVTLHLAPGSRLVASTERADYPNNVFIQTFGAHDVAITGTGLIDGRGEAFMARELPHIYRPADPRPKLMILEAAHRVRLRDFVIRNAANWAIHLAGCDDVVIDGVTIRNDLRIPNCDGIDPDHSRNVAISNCHIEAGDDCIVIKNRPEYAKYGPAENITVTNCTLVSTSAALKIGTETTDVVRDVVFSNCVVRGSHRGVALMLRDAGSIENVLIQNLSIETRLFHSDWWGAAEPVAIVAIPRTTGGKIGHIKGVRIDHVVARGEGGVVIHGSPESVVEDVVLSNVTVTLQRTSTEALGRIDLRPLPANEVGQGPLTGFWIAHAREVTLRNCTLRWAFPAPANARPLTHDEATTDIRVENFREFGRAAAR